jgi:hypothetical protein
MQPHCKWFWYAPCNMSISAILHNHKAQDACKVITIFCLWPCMYLVDWRCVIWWWILCVTLQISDWQVWGVCVMIILQIHKNEKEPNNENLVRPIMSFFYLSPSMIPIKHRSYNIDRFEWKNLILHEMFFFNDVLHHW